MTKNTLHRLLNALAFANTGSRGEFERLLDQMDPIQPTPLIEIQRPVLKAAPAAQPDGRTPSFNFANHSLAH